MAFRPDTENRSRPSLGYRISSNRQPGVEIANNRMPSRPRFNPGDMPPYRRMPGPTPGRDIPDPRGPMPMPFPRPGEGRPAPMPMPMPRRTPQHMIDQLGDMFGFGDRRKERYIANTRGGYEGIGSLTPSNIGFDLGPTETQMAGYVPGDYGDDDYGSYIPDSVLEGDRDFQYGPSDEYEFDYLQGLDALPDFKPEYIARGGLMSLRR